MGEEQQTVPRRSCARLIRGALIGITFSVLGLYLVLRLTGGYHSWAELAQIGPVIFIIACSLMLLARLLDSLRMKLLAYSLGANISIADGIRISILGTFLSNITPLGSGGWPTRVYLLTESGLNPGESTAVMATKALCNTFGRFTLGLAASVWLFCFSDSWTLPTTMGIIVKVGLILYFVGLALALLFIIHSEKIKVFAFPVIRNRFTLRFFQLEKLDNILDWIDRELTEFHNALMALLRKKRPLLLAIILLSYGWWIAITIVPAVVLAGLGLQPSFLQVMAITMVFYLAASYAPTPGGSGVAELGFGLLFSSIVPHSLIGLFVAIWRGLTYYLNLIVGGVLLVVEIVRRGSLPERIGFGGR